MSIFQSRKTVLLHDMTSIQKYLRYAADYHAEYAKTWKTMGENLFQMMTGQNSAITPQMTRFSEIMAEIGQCHERLAAEELRNSEDFNDIIERYNVLYRTNSEHVAAKEKYKAACAALEKAIETDKAEESRPDYEAKRKVKCQNEIEKQRSNKAQTLKDTISTLEALIATRTKYSAFKVRRLISGWNRFGHALKVESQNEIDLIAKAQDVLDEIKNTKVVDPENLKNMERAIESHIEAAPAPAIVPTQETFEEANKAFDAPPVDEEPLNIPEQHQAPEIPEEPHEEPIEEHHEDLVLPDEDYQPAPEGVNPFE
ncbi:hypothetical protein TVAG_006790 [Trichomonas vaginalis G3]|uniref:Uncharacterized protein n=1 Tax=Trichomonas vaginalis (strain ATCC PRA-98 / G3) TaxID=412133 RepID=A2FC02_TRIV3|nr:hypothetical protein TVAGG3_0964170 [Trichomonas vaginalis G3]EAX97548.1 hypothetical protein TVAG_006790 [Trichomonas vaginalis G3]KAI5488121.1 hypothetical protein TVAGG3_0964170 [Trichomonas vaginalis G3]|eukprot:XP_001310478.1 hypothetical protein [Trichomonas vaginalis G3]